MTFFPAVQSDEVLVPSLELLDRAWQREGKNALHANSPVNARGQPEPSGISPDLEHVCCVLYGQILTDTPYSEIANTSNAFFLPAQVLGLQANRAVNKSAAYSGVIDNLSKVARAEWKLSLLCVRVNRTWPRELSV